MKMLELLDDQERAAVIALYTKRLDDELTESAPNFAIIRQWADRIKELTRDPHSRVAVTDEELRKTADWSLP